MKSILTIILLAGTLFHPLSANLHQSLVFQWLGENPLEGDKILPFQETRHYQLKKTDIVLHGVMRIRDHSAISIEYLGNNPTTLILDKRGLIIRSPDQPQKQAPDEAAIIVSVFLNLIRFNSKELEKEFSWEEKVREKEWRLTLTPKTDSLRRFFRYIDLEGSGSQLRTIRIQNASSRWKRLSFPDQPTDWVPSESELALYF